MASVKSGFVLDMVGQDREPNKYTAKYSVWIEPELN